MRPKQQKPNPQECVPLTSHSEPYLDGFKGHMTSSKYAKIAKCSIDTALHDIRNLDCRTDRFQSCDVVLSAR